MPGTASLEPFFSPQSVAVIGASRTPGKIGYAVSENLIKAGFKGKLFLVNPQAEEILGRPCVKSVSQLNGIDLGIVCVPAELVPGIVAECGKKRFKALVIISSGFDEIGNQELTEKLRRALRPFPTMRVIGPNCLGIMNMKNRVDSLFLPEYRLKRPKPGGISFISQSGAVGSAILDWASMMDYGVGKFISYGNALDIDETDLLTYLVNDPETKVIVLYLEGVKSGRKFFEAAKKLAWKKPVIVLKGGITAEGGKAAGSHTGSLAGSAQVYAAAFKQTGMIPAGCLQDLFDYARTFIHAPEARGKRVQIITDGGGYGVVAADAVALNGLQLANMQESALAAMRKQMPSYVVLKNPLDLTGGTSNEWYGLALGAALTDKNVDLIALIILFQVPNLTSDVVQVISNLNARKTKPLTVISVGGEFSEVHKRAMEHDGIVTFSYPENAIRSLKALADFYEFQRKKKRKP
ncbi:MAG: CoA-binding protein [Candidatus Diapherotrites archaeon]|uniref:CoA-binding protein n=1 Tax=Candidatus Iainarchaeum sp. TaxID=3101447 RepID=A0A8T4L717_9ARCH|nr:CoA-binding protein [Candidatus Diapherotrites archaeon]